MFYQRLAKKHFAPSLSLSPGSCEFRVEKEYSDTQANNFTRNSNILRRVTEQSENGKQGPPA